jgi:hypothetical protein
MERMRGISLFALASAVACAACGVLLGSSSDDDSPPAPPPPPGDATPIDATGSDTSAPDAARDADAAADADAKDAVPEVSTAPDADAGPGCTVLFADDFDTASGPAVSSTLWNLPVATASNCTATPTFGVTSHGTGVAAFTACPNGSGVSYFLSPKPTFPRDKHLRFSFAFQILETGDSIFLHATNVYSLTQGFGLAVEHGTSTIYGGQVNGASGTATPSKDVSWSGIGVDGWHTMVVDISFATPLVVSATLDGVNKMAAGPASTTATVTPTAFRFGIDHGAGAQKNLFDDVVISTCTQ